MNKYFYAGRIFIFSGGEYYICNSGQIAYDILVGLAKIGGFRGLLIKTGKPSVMTQ